VGADHADHPVDPVDRVPSDVAVSAVPVTAAKEEGLALERREGWGMSVESVSRVFHPTSARDVVDAYAYARTRGWKVAFWGGGRSYGDAALNESNLLVDFGRMDRIVEWDRGTGRVVVEPGVTLEKLWKSCLPDGWWPPVVSGTMFTTIGGLLAANAHGKNNWKHGPIGEHVESFEFVSPDGQTRVVSPESDPELFHTVIGGFGLLGAITKVALRMKKVHSGRLEVVPFTCADLDEMFRGFERCNTDAWDYVVGWIDAFPTGTALGRGQIHAAKYVGPGDDPEGQAMFHLSEQELPDRILGIFPKAWIHRLGRPFAGRLGWRLLNFAKFLWDSRASAQNHRFLQPHAQFNFLLDYVPDWKKVYAPGGLIQYQLFLPTDRAKDVARRVLETAQQARLEPRLVVMKRHRADKFLMSHAIDGYSFAMDFAVTDDRREDLWRLTRLFNEMVVEAGGRFYFAKDQVVSPDAVKRAFGHDRLARFFAMKAVVDPDDLLQGNLWRRVFGPIRAQIGLIPREFATATREIERVSTETPVEAGNSPQPSQP
jgi:decaprenylphospho-beta-D-ribofuranose 2-oxidase